MVEDAPGWGGEPPSKQEAAASSAEEWREKPQGPICWKCRGTGKKPCKRPRLEAGLPEKPSSSPCTVCTGTGRSRVKKAEAEAANLPGVIRKARTPPPDWKPAKPLAFGLMDAKESVVQKWSDLARRSDGGEDIVLTEEMLLSGNSSATHALPVWLPRKGEELCKLNGCWRILQRVGGHRWTTDDLLTAYIAVRETSQLCIGQAKDRPIRYLDLGTGNGSVLQMTTRALLQQELEISARAIEARREAVDLARRSLQFNVGPDFDVKIVHGDFRDVLTKDATMTGFDLVTGTPPYFRVDFLVQGDQVTSAVIRQGGMPTARQSAPARCEFRGGIEAYCEAASQALSVERGRFVVCENFLNHDRVLQAAQEAGLAVLRCVQVQGRKGRQPLFCVYVMKRPLSEDATDAGAAVRAFEEETIAVRDDDGNWTNEYAETVFETMSIPLFAPDRTTK